MRYDVKYEVFKRVNQAIRTDDEPEISDNNSNENYNPNKKKLTIGYHYRIGHADGARKPVDVDYHVLVIDSIVNNITNSGSKVEKVYLSGCCTENDHTIISQEKMTEKYNRDYKFSILPQTLLGNGEVEFALTNALRSKSSSRPPTYKLYTEFMADIEAFTRVDIFIGTRSNVYGVVAALRMSRYPDRPKNHTCFLDILLSPPPLICEGSNESKLFWTNAYGPWGLLGGTPFFK